MKRTKTYQLALAGMLIAVGIIIPTFSPIKIIIEPASFTLASPSIFSNWDLVWSDT